MHENQPRGTACSWWLVLIGLQAVAIIALVVSYGPSESRDQDTVGTPRRPAADAGSNERGEVGTNPIPTNRFDGSNEEVGSGEPASSADDPLGIVLYGRILDEDGATVGQESQVVLWLYDASDRQPTRAPVDARAGTYTLVGLRPGHYWMVSRARGFVEGEHPVELATRPFRRRMDLVLRRAINIAVYVVTSEGVDLRSTLFRANLWTNLAVVATRTHPGNQFPPSDLRNLARHGIGRFRHAGGKRSEVGLFGSLELHEPPPVYVSLALRHVVLATQQLPVAKDRVTFSISLDDLRSKQASVTARFVDRETNKPVAGYAIMGGAQSSGPSQKIGDDGRVTFKGRNPGLLEISVEAAGYERHFQHIVVPPGANLDLGTIRLARSTSIEGVLVDPAGTPIKCRYEVFDPDHPIRGQLRQKGGQRADEDGRFKIERLGRRRYLLRTWDEDRAIVITDVHTGGGSVSGLRVTVPEGAPVTLRPELPRGEIPTCEIRGSDGRPRWRGKLYRRLAVSLRLPPGSYTLRITNGSMAGREHAFVVKGDPVNLPITP